MLVAGEPSGDALGAGLMAALKRQITSPIEFQGVGGPMMTAVGLESLFPMSDLSIMGIAEVLPQIPKILGRLRQTAEMVERNRPDIVVTIDSPGFNFRLAKRLHPLRKSIGFKIVHMVAPSVWVYRPGRARKIAPLFDHLLALLPFEPPYFEKEGLACTFIGHPVVEARVPLDAGAKFRSDHNIDQKDKVLCVLAGSRHSETSRLLPVFGEAVKKLVAKNPNLKIVVPTVSTVVESVTDAIKDWPGKPVLVEGTETRFAAFAASDAAVAASGTVALELSLVGVPMVVAYRLHPITHWIAKRLVRIDQANLVNIVLGKVVVPELLQNDCTPEKIVREIDLLFEGGESCTRQIEAGREAMAMMGQGGDAPSDRAASVIQSMLVEDTTKDQS